MIDLLPTFTTIAMDPPWNERGGGKRGADEHYDVVRTNDMVHVIRSMEGWRPDSRGCSVWCWATIMHLEAALHLLRMLGAPYVTHWVWVKDGHPGIGQRLRGAHELLLWGAFGSVPVPPPHRRTPSVFYAPRPCIPGTNRPRHSAKPDEAFRIIETHDPPGPRMELFARDRRTGWEACGNQLAPP